MQKKKGIALVLSFALVICLGVAGVLAYLTATTKTVTNEFTVGNIKINLDESKAAYENGDWVLDTETRVEGNKYEHVYPGAKIDKDPTVEVIAGSEACWLFVTVSPDAGAHDLLDYEIAEGWTKLEAGVYYRTVDLATANAGETYSVLKGDADQVAVKTTATGTSTFQDIVFNAYAVQSKGIDTAEAAWAQVKPANA